MKTCIITGASRGIGRATAIKMSYSDSISNLVIISRNEKKLDETKLLMNNKKKIKVVVYDLENLIGIEAMVKSIYDEFKSIDILLNIAGYAEQKTALLDTNIENIEKIFKINVFSMFELIKKCVKYMKDKKDKPSKILNVASTAGLTPRPGWIPYSTSKAAVIAMTQSLTIELSQYKIKTYCISPGRCATDLRKILAPEEDPTTIMQPEDVADLICSLMNDSEKYLDGQNIIVSK